MQYFKNFALSQISTFKIGGTCECLAIIKSLEDLEEAVQKAQTSGLALYIHGGGSNVVFEDAHFHKMFLWMQNKHISHDADSLRVQAGCSWVELSRYCKEHQILGLEPLMTIPGTIGGAAYGNAGAFGLETLSMVKEVELIKLTKGLAKSLLSSQDFNYSYRQSSLQNKPNELIWAVSFDRKKMQKRYDLQAIKEERDQKQPKGLTTGSFFKNPEGDHAGRLIEACGLKGYRIGGAQISEKHANFFMNVNQASFQDIVDLADLVQKTVLERFGVRLEREVHFIFAKS